LKNYRIIAAAFLGMVMLLGCAKTDIGKRYDMEKMLTNADRLQDQIKQKGKAVSDEDLKQIVDAYSRIAAMIEPPKNSTDVQQASQEKQQTWALASLANTRIGVLYLSLNMYDKAYDILKIIADSPATTPLQKNALLSYMALAQEKLKRYPEAAAIYDSLAQGYLSLVIPDSPNMDALDAPVKLAGMWAKSGNNDKYLAGMDKARDYYNGLVSKFKGTLTESAALGKIAATYIEQQNYPQAIATLRMVRPDSSGHSSPSILLMIADIYMNNLKSYPQAENTYREFVDNYPAHASLAAATLGIGLSLFEQGKYTAARKAVENLDNLPKADSKSVAEAIYLTGLCYEKEDKWELARGQFDIVQTSFPGSNEAFESALYVADHYRIDNQKDLTKKAFDQAVAYINKYVAQNPSDQIACSRALGYLVRAYIENGDLEKGAEQLAHIHELYPQLPEGKLAPLRIADIYENNLHNPAKAVTWLKTFVSENPDAPNLNDVKSHIETLEAHLNSK
jgi:TolA-binding protein